MAIPDRMSAMQVLLQNNTAADSIHVAITGTDNTRNALWLLQSDGVTGYNPPNPAANQQPLQVNCDIVLGACGSQRQVTVPQLSGARIWFCENAPLTFLLNQGPSGPQLVEPSATNTADPNYALRWSFCEFTYNTQQVFANISYVDFVSIPVALRLDSADGTPPQVVQGMPPDGLSTVCEALQRQHQNDGAGWDKLVVLAPLSSSITHASPFLRALSPASGIATTPGLFQDYYMPYVDAVWARYASATLEVDTQAAWGVVAGKVDTASGLLQFPATGDSFTKPAAADIFSCSTGAFSADAGNTRRGCLIARLAAAFNRSTLLTDSHQPSAGGPAGYYAVSSTRTNYYARVVHAANLEGRGYAFPYDDVRPSGTADQSGAVACSRPARLSVYIGGRCQTPPVRTLPPPRRRDSPRPTRITKADLAHMARKGEQLVAGRRTRRLLPRALLSSLSASSSSFFSSSSSSSVTLEMSELCTAAARAAKYIPVNEKALTAPVPQTALQSKARVHAVTTTDALLGSARHAARSVWSWLQAVLPPEVAGPLCVAVTALGRALDTACLPGPTSMPCMVLLILLFLIVVATSGLVF